MKINEVKFSFKGEILNRPRTDYIVLHHRAGNGDIESIHRQHLGQDYAGIGYHYYVRKDGSVYTGRPIQKVGAHCLNYNSVSVGVCFEGNYETESVMPEAQKKAGIELVRYLKGIYPNAGIKKHCDLFATACPGKYFPFEEIKKGAETMPKLESANDIVWELMNGRLKVEITEVDKAVRELEEARIKNSSLYWILYKVVNG